MRMMPDAVAEPIQEIEPPFPLADEINLLDIVIVLSKRRIFICCATVGIAVLTSIAVLLMQSQYTAETVVLPPGQNGSSALLGQIGSGGLASLAGASLGIKNPSDLYVALFQSRTVEDSMVQRFKLMDRYHAKTTTAARLAFESHATVIPGTKDGLIRIDVTDPDPKLAAEMANGYVDQFRKLSANLAITEASQRRAFFQQQLMEANQHLAAAEDAMKSTEQKTGVLQVDSQARSLIESAASLRAEVVAKQVQIQGMQIYGTDSNPDIVAAKQQLAALQAQLAKVSGSKDNPDVTVREGNIPETGLEYIRRMRDVKYNETIADLLANQFEAAKLDEAREGAVIQVVDVAVPPDNRSFPKRTISVVVAALLGFFGACGWCILAEAWDRLKNRPDQELHMEALRDTFR